MTVLLTGAAGFIGFHVANALLDRGERVVGVDSVNDYYDPALKQARLDRLEGRNGFAFHRLDIADPAPLFELVDATPDIETVIHLAAQAGVRYSLENPWAYADANVRGQIGVLEASRRLPRLKHIVYASSSSVYGGNTKIPFAVGDPVERPVSVYAVTKRSGELLADTYAHLYGMALTGLRFFTVYGPWGRPDMAYFSFTKAILEGTPIQVFNSGEMKRDFTYIDDIVEGVLAAAGRPPKPDDAGRAHRIYNLGNHRAEPLPRFIEVIEKACRREARKELVEMQPGDVKETYADIEASRRDLDFDPRTPIDEGIPRFVAWFRDYYGV
ncbi:NAD-dependent epimerase/dehydratase family protein [Ferruginivarius sediminum]|uniref:NAD-dependent epimerase/dehydratase family protein n=1 Tax=Ferruginivarius sediminum TaxID=2661937 RepID=A0A369T6K7_9PROT|nr:NAD-dependent epimerase/dehydratase family protein [Ferruginivarius sediminum]RDD60959.1 NAD-dependent epimerase/dehydratase family protein [Ferruginivarius sediminum]